MNRILPGVFIFTLLLGGCTSRNPHILETLDLDPPVGATRIPVPHISQNDSYSCGTTALAMALSWYEKRTDQPLDKDLAWALSGSDIQFAHTQGHDIAGFDHLLGQFGYRGELVDGLGLPRLKQVLSNGILAVLLIQPEIGKQNTHAVLAIGFVDSSKTLIVEDPAQVKNFYGYGELSDYWKAFVPNPARFTKEAAYIVYPRKNP